VRAPNALLVAGALVLILAPSAYPQTKEIYQLQADMLNLSNQMKQLQSSVDAKTQAILSLLEKLTDQTNIMKADLQKMNGLVSGVKSDNDRTAGELRKLVADLSHDVDLLNQGMSGVRTQLGDFSRQLAALKSSPEALRSPADLMREGYSDFNAGNYDLAIQTFREFLSQYPTDPRAVEAQLQVGEALYNQAKYEQAIVDYDLVLQNYPKGDRSKVALYKKGLSLEKLGKIKEAIEMLTFVVKDFPGTTEAINAKQKINELSRKRQ